MERSTTAFDLFHRCAARDADQPWLELESEFGQWVRGCLVHALSRLRVRVVSDLLAELTQEVWCRLLEKDRDRLRGFRGRTRAAAALYLQRICQSVVIDQWRASRTAKRGGPLPRAWREVREVEVEIESARSEERVLSRELRLAFRARCRAAVGGRAPLRSARMVELAVLHGWTSLEISRRFAPDLTPSAIDSVVHRARRRLRAGGLALPAR